MKKSSLLKTACAVGVSFACVGFFTGCSNTHEESSSQDSIAATVDGVEIYESEVTAYIQNYRSQSGYAEDAAWGELLATAGMNGAGFREDVIEGFVTREIIRTKAAEQGIVVEDAEIDAYVEDTKAYYETEEEWEEALVAAGMTEDEYREEIKLQLTDQYLQESFSAGEPSEEDLLLYAQMYATTYDGAKKSSHILFSADDAVLAQEVLDKINSGELDFTTAAQEYSLDSTSAVDGGNVGWDKMTSFVTEYQEALDALQKDQISALVESTYGVHIILCTDVYEAPKTTAEDGTSTVTITSLDQIPADWIESISTDLTTQQQTEAYDEWLTAQRELVGVVIYDMPSGLPYDLDVTQYEAVDSAGLEYEELEEQPEEQTEATN